MGAYEELSRTGECGDLTVALLRRLGAQVVRSASFPPPEGYANWTPDAVDDLLTTMFSKKGQKFVLGCLTKATDDPSLERLLITAITNFLIDEAKGTERGKLRRRLQTLLGNDGRFIQGPGWALAAHSAGAVWQGDVGELQEVAADVRGVILGKLPPSGPTPKGSAHALVTVAYEVLLAAGGAVREEDLTRVLETRFGLGSTPTFVSLSADERFLEVASLDAGPEDIVIVAEERAQLLWEELAPSERSLVPHLDRPVEDVMEVAEVGRATAESLRASILEKIMRATIDDEQQEATLRALRHLCRTCP